METNIQLSQSDKLSMVVRFTYPVIAILVTISIYLKLLIFYQLIIIGLLLIALGELLVSNRSMKKLEKIMTTPRKMDVLHDHFFDTMLSPFALIGNYIENAYLLMDISDYQWSHLNKNESETCEGKLFNGKSISYLEMSLKQITGLTERNDLSNVQNLLDREYVRKEDMEFSIWKSFEAALGDISAKNKSNFLEVESIIRNRISYLINKSKWNLYENLSLAKEEIKKAIEIRESLEGPEESMSLKRTRYILAAVTGTFIFTSSIICDSCFSCSYRNHIMPCCAMLMSWIALFELKENNPKNKQQNKE